MNIQITESRTNQISLNMLEMLEEDLISEDSYGLEYILDELFDERLISATNQTEIDWHGLTDLSI